MEEVFAVCDRITILRDGRVVATRLAAETCVDEVLRLMVGRPIDAMFTKVAAHEIGPSVLEVRGLSAAERFRDVSFQVRAGEIVSLAGLVGSGRTEVAEAIFGIARPDEGEVLIAGQTVRIRHPRDAVAQGLALVPEDRQHHGVFMPQSAWRNASVAIMERLARLGWVRDRESRRATAVYVDRLRIRLRGQDQPVRELSGGNQQKVVLARWLLTKPRVLILDEPTRGIDVGAKAEVHRLIAELAAGGMAVLMVSSDMPEVLGMSDRILVMREGRIAREFAREAATAEAIIAAATGQALEDGAA
jgi:rhamnose transport system ATP-binding protein